MNTNKEAKRYLNKYFPAQYINEKDDEFKALVRLLNKAQQQVKNCNTPDVNDLLIAWEQFKKTNGWKSDAVDVEKVLMDKFHEFYKR